jgi:hypothetical protein
MLFVNLQVKLTILKVKWTTSNQGDRQKAAAATTHIFPE